MTKELFLKYLDNQCTSDELDLVLSWFEHEATILKEREAIKLVWDEFAPDIVAQEENIFETLLDRLHHQINLRQRNISGLAGSEKPGTGWHRLSYFLIRAAAVLFLPLLAAFLYTWVTFRSLENGQEASAANNIEIVAPVGSRTFVELPDGTGVHLNHGSRLSYPQKFAEKERKVILSGEAFFSVAKDVKKPFRVETGNLLVTALGTMFNIMAYPEQKYLETSLTEGRVLVQNNLPGKKIQTLKEMEPGQHFRLNKEKNSFTCTREDLRKYISWKDGLLIFKNDPLEEITSRLGRWYNTDFEFADESLKQYPYTATFVDETLPQILDLLQMATPLRYEITSRIKQSDGTFSKPKVIIRAKR